MAATGLNDLPNDIAERIRRLGETSPEDWVHKPIPALGHRSVMEVHDAGGDDDLRQFLLRVEGKFGR